MKHTSGSSSGSPQTAAKVVAATVVTVEGLIFIVFASLDFASLTVERFAVGAGVGTFFLIYGGTQVFAAYALLRGEEWPRGALVFTQLIQIGLAWNVRQVDPPWLAWSLFGPALLAAACLLYADAPQSAADENLDVRD